MILEILESKPFLSSCVRTRILFWILAPQSFMFSGLCCLQFALADILSATVECQGMNVKMDL